MGWRAIWSPPIASAGSELRSSDSRRLSNELISSKTSPEVQFPLSPPSEHMFALYRNYVRCQGFRNVNLRASLPRQTNRIYIQTAPQLPFPSLLRTRDSPPGVARFARGRPPPRGGGGQKI